MIYLVSHFYDLKNKSMQVTSQITGGKRWIDEGARTLHLIDLDGAFQDFLLLERPGWKAFTRIRPTTNPPIWAKKATLDSVLALALSS